MAKKVPITPPIPPHLLEKLAYEYTNDIGSVCREFWGEYREYRHEYREYRQNTENTDRNTENTDIQYSSIYELHNVVQVGMCNLMLMLACLRSFKQEYRRIQTEYRWGGSYRGVGIQRIQICCQPSAMFDTTVS